MIKIEIKYNSVKQGKEEELQSVFLAIGTQRLEKSNFVGLVPDTEEHEEVINYLLDVIINPLDSDIMSIAFLANYLVEYKELNSMINETKHDVKTYLQLIKVRNETASRCEKIIKEFCLTPASRKNLMMIWGETDED